GARVPTPWQVSSVQTWPWLVQAVPAAVWQSWAASLQMSSHSAPPVHGSPPCVQVPPLQVSVPLQKRPSSQDAVLGVCAQVPEPLQASSVQTLPSLVRAVSGAVAQVPSASSPLMVQSAPASQAVPLCVVGRPL